MLSMQCYEQEAVLWTLLPDKPSDAAFHCGASLKLLSQFEEEDEVLFPPCTMLVVLPEASHDPAANGEGNGGGPVRLTARPHFI